MSYERNIHSMNRLLVFLTTVGDLLSHFFHLDGHAVQKKFTKNTNVFFFWRIALHFAMCLINYSALSIAMKKQCNNLFTATLLVCQPPVSQQACPITKQFFLFLFVGQKPSLFTLETHSTPAYRSQLRAVRRALSRSHREIIWRDL